MKYVPLDRQFTVTDDDSGGDLDVGKYAEGYWHTSGWPKLLINRRVVILAEAGSGKSDELEDQTITLRAQGEFAFYAKVQDVGNLGLVDALGRDRAAFEKWKASDQPAWFFIDSVDEAKLDHIELSTALNRLAVGFDGALERTHLILSSRDSDWDRREDLEKLMKLLPIPDVPAASELHSPTEALILILNNKLKTNSAAPKEQPLVVIMNPLDEGQIRKFAADRGVVQLDEFIAAIDDGDLWNLARRPLDLDWLAAYWVQNKKFGKFAVMLAAILEERLKEPNPQHQRNDQISVTAAMAALERVGAALVFGRTDTLAVPDSASSGASNKLAFDAVLPDWSSDHRVRLRNRAVFDGATFGRMRLHNDNQGQVRGFLAARWLLRMRNGNCSANALLDLLFAETYGLKLVRPSVVDTVAWLSIWDADVAREVVARSPRILLTFGDPASLTLDVREAALESYVKELIETDAWAGLFEEDGLRRFSTPDIVPRLRSIWSANKEHGEVRRLILRMVTLGHLTDCADMAAEATFGPDDGKHTQLVGARALLPTADEPMRRRYATFVLKNASSLNASQVAEAIDAFFPTIFSVADFLKIYGAVDWSKVEDGVGLARWNRISVARLIRREDLGELLAGLLELVGPPGPSSTHQETTLEQVLFPLIREATVCILGLSGTDEAPAQCIDAAMRLAVNRFYRQTESEDAPLRAALCQSSERRRAVFWHVLARLGETTLVTNYMQIEFHGLPIGLKPSDINWLLEDALTRTAVNERVVAISAALAVCRDNGKDQATLDRIEAVAKQAPETATLFESWMKPYDPSPEEIELNRESDQYQKQNALEIARRDQSWIDFIDRLKADPDQLARLNPVEKNGADGRLFSLWELLNSTASRSRYEIDDLNSVRDILGDAVTENLQVALIAYWRQRIPVVNSAKESDKRNITSQLDCMGLVGVSLEARQNPAWTKSLSSEDAVRAAGFATIELNGYPSWFDSLMAARPDEVRKVLVQEITAPISIGGSVDTVDHGELQRVLYASVEISKLVASDLFSFLKARTPEPVQTLTDLLDVISRGLHTEADKAEFLAFAQERFASSTNLDLAALYLGAAFKVDPAQATTALVEKLDQLSPTDQTRLGKRVLPRLFGDRLFRSTIDPQLLPVGVLERLVEIAYQTIRVEDDHQHQSGVGYSFDDRDEAEMARSAVFGQLVNTPGRSTYDALKRLANRKGFTQRIIEDYAMDRAARDSEAAPWLAGDAFAFEKDCDTAPRTPVDLQRVATRRISDIDHDLHHARFSQGQTVKALPNEREVQKWVADQFESRQRRSYTVVREPHVVDEKEPDINLQATASDARLPIEIKVAESWTLLKLEEALNVQLGGRYLRHKDEKHGILLLVHQAARPEGWMDSTGKYLAFAEVVEHLRSMADATAGLTADSAKATIAVIDVSDVAVPTKKPA